MSALHNAVYSYYEAGMSWTNICKKMDMTLEELLEDNDNFELYCK